MDPNTEATPGLVKAAMFSFAIALGFAAKMANMNRRKAITLKEFLYQVAITAATAWVMWFLFKKYETSELWIYIWAVFIGKFGDQIFTFVWETIKFHFKKEKL